MADGVEKVFDFVVSKAKQEVYDQYQRDDELGTRKRAFAPTAFSILKQAHELIEPCVVKALHHRSREEYYTEQLEEAEVELREKGISVEVYDQSTQSYFNPGHICSGNITGGMTQNFQPRVDQKLLDAVKYNKSKMLEHRGKAESYEKYRSAFACGLQSWVRLTIEDIHFFGLGG